MGRCIHRSITSKATEVGVIVHSVAWHINEQGVLGLKDLLKRKDTQHLWITSTQRFVIKFISNT